MSFEDDDLSLIEKMLLFVPLCTPGSPSICVITLTLFLIRIKTLVGHLDLL